MTTTSTRKADIREHITTHHQRFLDVANNLRSTDFDLPLYSGRNPDEWRVRGAIAHLDATAVALLHNAQAIAEGGDPLPLYFDLTRWNKNAVTKAIDMPVETLLTNVERSHQKWLQFLQEIPVSHLSRRGRHALGDVLSIEGFMRRYAEHEAHHATEIRVALRREHHYWVSGS